MMRVYITIENHMNLFLLKSMLWLLLVLHVLMLKGMLKVDRLYMLPLDFFISDWYNLYLDRTIF